MVILKNKNYILFFGYIVFAGIATIIDIGTLFILTSIINIHYFVSGIIAYCLGMITNYTLNKKYNFKNKDKKIMRQFSVFFIIASIGLALNQIILWILVEFFTIWYLFAKVISISIVMFWSFFAHKLITFRTDE